ncbi:hypothetical protein Tco_1182118 [Tanacetum coccineum]
MVAIGGYECVILVRHPYTPLVNIFDNQKSSIITIIIELQAKISTCRNQLVSRVESVTKIVENFLAEAPCVVSDRAPTFHQHHARTSDRTATVTPAIDSQIGPSASQVGLVYNWSWLRLTRTGPDLAELEDLCSLVAHVRLSLNQDIWECTIDNSRTFIVKAMNGFDMPLPVAVCSGLVNSSLKQIW